MENRYLLQQLHSVTKRWMIILEGNIDEMEREFKIRSEDAYNIKFGHKYRVVELSLICHN